ncbi:MAG: peptidylprolyl isomerase [Rhodobacter sp.]|uniref:FKBP-type peptidyl-prolyl cis-trans isomerase n=1 Tax=Pararhodobacter sp. TaxID=2127056 RepID=UPI001D57437F|nr:peptidylprolyl isomerase [Pararhodobacter sp.]MCB1344120.1 peptidylprolyl isomerase [Paracoccaceae bacterium]MCB1408989.1 peptidylprolyl isomerase [Paracoccaceae bacterium]MCC0073692.1 peptidylprolyl isomerase [Rhodobacter sp.]HPD93039.1 peptidylprolyl isomerase [Pararhodobacter sp.]
MTQGARQAQAGDTVHFHYTGTLADGSVFDSSEGREPLSFTLGSGQIIRGLDAAIAGMAVGEAATVTIPAADAYGEADPAARQAIPRAQIPPHIPTEPGTALQMQTPQGQTIPVVVVEANEDEVVLDANHPLAGKDLTFAVEIVAIR